MKWIETLASLSFCTLSFLAAEENSTQEKSQIKKLDPSVVHVQPDHITIQDRVRFRHGNPDQPYFENVFELSLEVGSKKSVHIARVASFTLDEALTDAQETLTLAEPLDPDDISIHSYSNSDGYDQHFDINLAFKPLKKEAVHISPFKGTLVLEVPGQLHRASFSPVGEWVGKTVTFEQAPGLDFTITSITETRPRRSTGVCMEYSRDLDNFIADIVFKDANGEELSTRGGGSSTSNERCTKYKYITLPADGSIEVHINGEIQLLTIPIHFEKLLLPKAPDPETGNSFVMPTEVMVPGADEKKEKPSAIKIFEQSMKTIVESTTDNLDDF